MVVMEPNPGTLVGHLAAGRYIVTERTNGNRSVVYRLSGGGLQLLNSAALATNDMYGWRQANGASLKYSGYMVFSDLQDAMDEANRRNGNSVDTVTITIPETEYQSIVARVSELEAARAGQ